MLIAGTTIAGVFFGGVLDPLGQRAARQSLADDERRRAARLAAEGLSADGGDGSSPRGVGEAVGGPVGHRDESVEEVWADADGDDSDDPAPPDRTVPSLVPSGAAPLRTACAAVITGALFAGAAAHFGGDLVLAPFCVLFAVLVVVSMTDLTHRLVPRRLLYGALALIVPLLVATAAVDGTWRHLTGAVVAGAASFAVFFAIWWFVPRGMGFGDVRLAGTIGVTVGFLSLLHAYVAFLAGFVVGMVFGLVLMAVTSSGRRTRIPFAPSLSVGAVIAVLWGGHLAQSLFHTTS